MLHRTSASQRGLLLLAALALFSGCHGGSVASLPRLAGGGTTPTPAPGSTGTLTAAQVTTAMQNVENSYLALPHTSVQSDLSALAAQMVSSGAYKAATVNPGGITATLPDGSTAVFFADVPADLGLPESAARATLPSRSRATAQSRSRAPVPVLAPLASPAQNRARSSLSQSSPNGVAILVNSSDAAFTPPLQQAAAAAFTAVFNNVCCYVSSSIDISLANIVALGEAQTLDFLVINTHGMVIGTAPNLSYVMSSTTTINDSDTALFSNDIANGRLYYAVVLTVKGVPFNPAQYAFTPQFLTEKLTFNPGAIVYNSSCYGANSLILGGVNATYQAAHVGRYYGWDKTTGNTSADQSEMFLIQRILGDSSKIVGLGGYVDQNFPPQRPFPLDDVQSAMGKETRNSQVLTDNVYYTVSSTGYAMNANAPPLGTTQAQLVPSDFGGESVANPPIEYAFPSIQRMAVTAESASGGALSIMGNFPSAKGSVTIADSSGTTTLPIVKWGTSIITVTLPPSGNGSSGLLTVIGNGIPSNAVPLTQWQGTLNYAETDTLTEMSGREGGGTAAMQAGFNVEFRADVHPFVPTIDATPTPQNLYFPQVEYAASSGAATALSGGFIDSDGDQATFSLAGAPPVMTPAYPPLPAAGFAMGATPPPSVAACNSGLPGAQTPGTTAFCPGFGFNATDVGTCADDPSNKNTLCLDETFGLLAATGGADTTGGDLLLTMDPATYAITLSTVPASFTTDHFTPGSKHQATAQMTATFSSPIAPPNDDTPADIRRQPMKKR